MRYLFYCPRCGLSSEAVTRERRVCGPCLVGPAGQVVVLTRDYRAENFGVGAGVRMGEVGTDRDYADLFLPTASDYAGPDDPDGSKGLREWQEKHEPRAGNKRPKRPEMPLGSRSVL